MNIRNISSLKETAAQRLDQAVQQRRISAIYAGITVGASALVTVVNYALSLKIDQTGGLSNMGTRTILSTVSTMLPLMLSVFLMWPTDCSIFCWFPNPRIPKKPFLRVWIIRNFLRIFRIKRSSMLASCSIGGIAKNRLHRDCWSSAWMSHSTAHLRSSRRLQNTI